MKNIPQVISTLYVWTNGDPSVGISGQAANVKSVGDVLIDLDNVAHEDRLSMLETLRSSIAHAFSEVWDEKTKVLFDFEVDRADESLSGSEAFALEISGTNRLVRPHSEPKPPVDWKRCDDEKCVHHPRWPKGSGVEHWHQPAWGQGFDAHVDYEPIPAVVGMRLRDLIAALNDSDAFEDHDQHKGQLEGYLASLRDTGTISSNHPLLVFFDCRSLHSI
ncbi:hypothetical protein RYA05_02080 [Pseudomonas syringae pv. actinidiae]|nr:hypothetical protein [Pseudomonas syringae pv. actinidiae]